MSVAWLIILTTTSSFNHAHGQVGQQKVCPQPCPSLDRLICFENQEIGGPEIGLIIEQTTTHLVRAPVM